MKGWVERWIRGGWGVEEGMGGRMDGKIDGEMVVENNKNKQIKK